MDEKDSFPRTSRGILRLTSIVLICSLSVWIGASLPRQEARASAPDYLEVISKELRNIGAQLKTTNGYLKDMEDSIERIQRKYTK